MKFVSPMALYLFTVFLMFAAFSFTTSDFFERAEDGASRAVTNLRDAITRKEQESEARLATLRAQLAAPNISEEQRATLTQQVATAEQALADLQVEWGKLDFLMSGPASSAASRHRRPRMSAARPTSASTWTSTIRRAASSRS